MAKQSKADSLEKLFSDFVRKLKERDPEVIHHMQELLDDVGRRIDYLPVTAREWTLTHPVLLGCGSDAFYVKLANKMQKLILEAQFPPNFPENAPYEIAMTCAAYMEDFVSGTGVWKAMRSLYRERYGQWLPFFDTAHDDYFEDDINIEDLKYLVWQTMVRCGQPYNMIYSPASEGVGNMARIAYDVILDHIDEAPSAGRVYDHLQKVFKKGDYFALRSLALWLVADNKITAVPDKREEMKQSAMTAIQKGIGIEIAPLYYEVEAATAWAAAVGMTGTSAQLLLGTLARIHGFDALAEKIAAVETQLKCEYEIVACDGKVMTVRNPFRECFDVDCKTLGKGAEPKKSQTYVGSIVKFGPLWHQNGIAVFLDRKPKWQNENTMIAGLPDDMLQKLRDKVKEKRGRRAFYFRSAEALNSFIGTNVPLLEDDNLADVSHYLLLISDTDQPVIVPDVCCIFSDRTNPFYDSSLSKEELAMESVAFIANNSIPDDVAAYIQENKLLPWASINCRQGKRVGKAMVQENLRFLCGFYRVPAADLEDEYLEEDE